MSTNYSHDWMSFTKLREKANRLNKSIVFDALSKAGITHVRVSFDGEGDQGQMDQATAQANGVTVEFPQVALTVWFWKYGSPELGRCERSLQDAVEDLCYGYLDAQHDGWEIDDGSFGEFSFDAAKREITLEYHGRLVETVDTTHTF